MRGNVNETKEETSNVEKSTTTLLKGSVRKMFLGDSSQKLILQLGEVNFIEEKKTVHCCMSDGEEYSQFVYFGPGLTNRARKLDESFHIIWVKSFEVSNNFLKITAFEVIKEKAEKIGEPKIIDPHESGWFLRF